MLFDLGMVLLFAVLLDFCGLMILHLSRNWYAFGTPSYGRLALLLLQILSSMYPRRLFAF